LLEGIQFGKPIKDRTGRFLSRAAGGVLSWAGIGLLALCLWILVAAMRVAASIEPNTVLIGAALALLGTFCVVVGFRMFLNRPNEHGSVLSQAGWLILASIFAVIAIFILFGALAGTLHMLVTILGVGWASVFSLLSFLAARRINKANK